MNRTTTLAAIVLLSTNLSLGALHAAKTIDRSFRVQPGGELDLQTDVGSVTLRGTAGSEVRIHVEYDRDLEGQIDFSFSQEGDKIIVRGEALKRRRFFGLLFDYSFRGNLQITAEVPERFNARVQASGGNVDASGLQGQIALKSSGGDVTGSRITGDVQLETSGGNVEASEINGPVRASTSGGNVSARRILGACSLSTSGGDVQAVAVRGDCSLETSGGSIQADSVDGSLNASTSGGDVEACLRAQPQGACTLETTGGNISLSVPAYISAELSARTTGGNVESDLPVKVFKTERGVMEGKLGQGGPSLILHTTGGDIRIKTLN